MNRCGWFFFLVSTGCEGGGNGAGGLFGGEKSFACTVAVHPSVATVLEVTWDSEDKGTSWVEFGLTEDLERGQSPETPDTVRHHHPIYGIPADTLVHYRAVFDDGSDLQVCEGTARTGLLPPTIQQGTEVTVDDPSQYDDAFILVSQVGSEAKHLTVYDRQGNVVWYVLGEGMITAVDSALDPETQQLLYMEQALDFHEDVATIYRTNWLREPIASYRAEWAHHGMEVQDDGTISYLALDERAVDLPGEKGTTHIAGDKLMELDPVTGESHQIWTVWDHMVPEPNDRWDIATYPNMKDWTHGNANHYYPESDTYLISLANIDTVVEVERSTGAIVETISPETYAFVGGATSVFEFQHDPRWAEDGSLSMTSTKESSIGVVYAIDRDAKTLEETWVTGEGEDLFAFSLGENIPHRSNGNRLVNFGSAGMLREVTASGEVVWEIEGHDAGAVAFSGAELFDDFYTMQ